MFQSTAPPKEGRIVVCFNHSCRMVWFQSTAPPKEGRITRSRTPLKSLGW